MCMLTRLVFEENIYYYIGNMPINWTGLTIFNEHFVDWILPSLSIQLDS